MRAQSRLAVVGDNTSQHPTFRTTWSFSLKYPPPLKRVLPHVAKLPRRLLSERAYDIRKAVRSLSGTLRRVAVARDVVEVRDSGLFDTAYYLQRYPDVRKSGMDPIVHYVLYGALEGRRPNAHFDSGWYLKQFPEVVISGANPLLHYVHKGEAAGHAPSDDVGPGTLRRSFPDVAPGGGRLLYAFLMHGAGNQGVASATDGDSNSGAGLHGAASKVREFIGKSLGSAPSNPGFRDFTEFNRIAPFIPPLTSPFTEEGKRVLGFMQAQKRDLKSRLALHPHEECPKVSVIMSGGSCLRRMEGAIERVGAQTYANIEVLVPTVNSDQSHATEKEGTEGLDIHYVPVHGEPDAQSQRLACARQATGEWLFFLDEACWLAADAVEILVASALENAWATVILIAHFALQDESFDKNDWEERLLPSAWDDSGATLKYQWYTPALQENRPSLSVPFLFVRRSHFVEKVCKLEADEAWPHFADWEVLTQVLLSARVRTVPVIIGFTTPSEKGEQVRSTAGTETARSQNKEDGLLSGPGIAPYLSGALPNKLANMTALPEDLAKLKQDAAVVVPQRACTVIIPSYECLPYLRACVESVCTFSDQAIKLIVVDNHSSNPVKDYLKELRQRPGPHEIEVILNERNYGFTYAVNQGIAASTAGSDIVLLNNDAVVTPGWLTALQRVIVDVPTAGLVVPRQTLLPHTKTMQTHNPRCDPNRELDVNLSLHHGSILDPQVHERDGYLALRFAPFFCVFITRELVETLGPLDYESGPHYRSDQLYCEAAREIAGAEIIYTPFSKLYHFLQQSTTELKDADVEGYKQIFVRNQWRDQA